MTTVAKIILTAVDQTKAATTSAAAGLSKLQGEAGKLQGTLNSLAGGVGIGALLALAKSAIDAGDAMQTLSKKSGLSVSTVSKLKFAADQSETSIEELAKGIKFLNRNMVENGQAFEAIGVAIKNSDGSLRRTEAVLLDVADVFARLPEGAQRTALAMQLFGKAGADLVPFLAQGKAGITDLMQEAERLGVVMSDDFAAASDQFNDNLAKLKAGLGSFTQAAFGPYVQGWSQILDVLNKMRAGKSMFKAIGEVADGQRAIDTTRELVAQTERLGEATAAANRARLTSHNDTDIKLLAILDRETTHVRATLNAQVAAYKEATAEIGKARAERLRIEEANADFLAKLRQGGATKPEDVSPLDVEALRAQGQRALESGDAATAIKLGEQAKKLIDDIVTSGTRSAAYMESFASQVVAMQNAAAAAQEQQARQRVADIERVFSETLVKAEALQKLRIGFDLPAAQQALDDLTAIMQAQLAGQPLVIPLVVPSEAALKGVDVPAKAGGGLMRGAGSDTSDNLLAWLSPGEYVVKAAAVRHYGAGVLSAINALALPRFAGGGSVGGGQSINLSWPGGGPFAVNASPEVAGQMVALFQREALKRGRRL
jgi:phage host-nuclease inhibitor protein Gam/polyhydroxyalkanoate synthesis regulator phasin